MKRYSHSVSCKYFPLTTWCRVFLFAFHIWLSIFCVFGWVLLLGTMPLPRHCILSSRTFLFPYTASIQAGCACLQGDHFSPPPCVAGAGGTSILAVGPQGRPNKDWRKAFAVEAFSPACLSHCKNLATLRCPLQSALQGSPLSGLPRIARYVLEGLLGVSRCCKQVQCTLFNLPLASLPFLMLV